MGLTPELNNPPILAELALERVLLLFKNEFPDGIDVALRLVLFHWLGASTGVTP